jgi:glucan biosynthesis protein C
MLAGERRINYLDNMRAFIIILVVLHHSLLAYAPAASSFWYVADQEKTVVFDALILINDMFMMPAMFFIAGFFVLKSLQHGIVSFLKKKILRILLPLLCGVFLLISPLISYLGHIAKGDYALNFIEYYFSVFLPKEVEPHHLWFLPFLFFLFLLYALIFLVRQKLIRKQAKEKAIKKQASPIFFISFGFLTTLLYFLATLFINDGYWFGIGGFFAVQVTRSVFYLSYFFLGIAAYRREWLWGNSIYDKGRIYIFTALILTVLTIVFRANIVVSGNIFFKAINALLHSYVCLTWLLSLLFIFHKGQSANRSAPGFLVTNSYKIYFIQSIPVIIMQLLLAGRTLPAYLKATTVFLIGLGASLFLSLVIQRVQILSHLILRANR